MKKIFVVIKLFLIISIYNNCYSQSDSFYVEKRECLYKENKASKLYIVKKNGELLKYSDLFYDFTELSMLSDTIKLELIRQLLLFESDTSLCCLNVTRYRNAMLEGSRGWPSLKKISIQIDALFMINKLCFPIESDFYSCFPVLYDTLTNKEISHISEKIKCVFAEYKKWYRECKAIGKIPKYFPFNDGRYVWYGGRKSVVAKE